MIRGKGRTIEIMSTVIFQGDIKKEKEIIQSSDTLRTRRGIQVGVIDLDATSGLGTCSFLGWLVFVAQERELCSRRIYLVEDLLMWSGCRLSLPLVYWSSGMWIRDMLWGFWVFIILPPAPLCSSKPISLDGQGLTPPKTIICSSASSSNTVVDKPQPGDKI